MIRVAVVEDEEEQVEIICDFLKRYEEENQISFNISVFNNGVKFLIDYQPVFDLVFMDIKMPHLNGLETARTIFSMDKHIGIVIVTTTEK